MALALSKLHLFFIVTNSIDSINKYLGTFETYETLVISGFVKRPEYTDILHQQPS